MRISNKHNGSFPRKSNNEIMTPHEGKILKLKSESKPKENPIAHTNKNVTNIVD